MLKKCEDVMKCEDFVMPETRINTGFVAIPHILTLFFLLRAIYCISRNIRMNFFYVCEDFCDELYFYERGSNMLV